MSEQEQEQQPEPLAVVLTQQEWATVLQLISLGVRNADDGSLELGGHLLNKVRKQLG